MTTMVQLSYEQSAATADAAVRCWDQAVLRLGLPRSIADLGCGPGHVCMRAADHGVRAYGVDISLPQLRMDLPNGGHLARADLTMPVWLPAVCDMVLCWEVAEHLPGAAAMTLCATLSRACVPGGVLLFTAATPGQGGAGHINERPHTYWERMLEELGFELDAELTADLRLVWSDVASDAWWYGQNLLAMRQARRQT